MPVSASTSTIEQTSESGQKQHVIIEKLLHVACYVIGGGLLHKKGVLYRFNNLMYTYLKKLVRLGRNQWKRVATQKGVVFPLQTTWYPLENSFICTRLKSLFENLKVRILKSSTIKWSKHGQQTAQAKKGYCSCLPVSAIYAHNANIYSKSAKGSLREEMFSTK